MVQKTCANCGQEFWVESMQNYQYKYQFKDKITHKHTINVYCCRSCMKADVEGKKEYRTLKW